MITLLLIEQTVSEVQRYYSALITTIKRYGETGQQRYEATKEELTRRLSNFISMAEKGAHCGKLVQWEEATRSSLANDYLGRTCTAAS